MVQANAFYSPEAKGILFGYFAANKTNQGRNLPGQCVFTCLSHDIIAHEVTHAVIDGIRAYFTEPTNPDVLAFHEAFAIWRPLQPLLTFGSSPGRHSKDRGRLYQFELKPDMASPRSGPRRPVAKWGANDAELAGEIRKRNPLIDLAQQVWRSAGINRGLRSALDHQPMRRTSTRE